ncbi:hypothetical protein FLA_3972 [Filimonas lacunae]|nr:hypothetical protein FLA_3972 [Filimonas lacunae]
MAATWLAAQPACKKTDGYNDIVSDDTSKPGVVTNVRVTNFNGGAYITYNLPSSKNILYVQAEYKINDHASRQTKSSFYSDSLTVSGFAKSQDYTVTLYAVSRAQVKSDPVQITVHPDTPPYLLVLPTIVLSNDFGGVNIRVTNKSKANLGIITIQPDAVTKKMEIINQNYTNQDSINYSIRGYDTTTYRFGVYITDQWGNISDTVYANIKPIYEVMMTKSLFKAMKFPSDVGTDFGWEMPYLWDNNTGSPGFHSTFPSSVPLPKWLTFDMGQSAKLSRYNAWFRGIDGSNNFLWASGAPQTWVIWGRNTDAVDETLPGDTLALPAVGQATPNGWINMGMYHLPAQPSGLIAPQYTNADLAYWNAGFPFNFDLNLPKVRYLRFECFTNAGGSNEFFNMMELSFWGDPR